MWSGSAGTGRIKDGKEKEEAGKERAMGELTGLAHQGELNRWHLGAGTQGKVSPRSPTVSPVHHTLAAANAAACESNCDGWEALGSVLFALFISYKCNYQGIN